MVGCMIQSKQSAPRKFQYPNFQEKIMKKSLFSALVILLLASATAHARTKRPIKLPPPSYPTFTNKLSASLPPAFWLSLYTGIVI